MKIIKSIEELDNLNEVKDVTVTIGNFDGVHLGHRDFLNSIKNESINLNRKMLVITFIPHPLMVLNARSHFLINTYEDRRGLLEECGVDYVLELDFTRDFSTQLPELFLNNFVFKSKKVKKLFLGHDFHFGANKTGDFELAKQEAHKKNIEIVLYSEFKISRDPVSSTTVRNLIGSGEVESANKLLGREYFLSGRVIKGMGRGKQIGFPTANLGYDRDLIIPSKGVYFTKTLWQNMLYESITNVGVNPTFNTGYDIHVETHLFGFSRDIYGEEIRVSFLKKLRDEKKFNSVNELVLQIEQDTKFAKVYFSNE